MKVVNMSRAPGYVKTDVDTYQVMPRSVMNLKGSKIEETDIKNLKVLGDDKPQQQPPQQSQVRQRPTPPPPPSSEASSS